MTTKTRKSAQVLTLVELVDEVIVLSVSFGGAGHVTVAGRVRYVQASPAVWVGECCLSPDVHVVEDTDAGHWRAYLPLADRS